MDSISGKHGLSAKRPRLDRSGAAGDGFPWRLGRRLSQPDR
jgi:hypothetical protein